MPRQELVVQGSSGLIYQANQQRRQQRFVRRSQPAPLTIEANSRAPAILWWLLKLRFLETQHFARLLYRPGSLKYAERQLRSLYDHGYLERFPSPIIRQWGSVQSQFGASRVVHCLAERGVRFLASELGLARRDLDWQPRHNRQPGNLAHTLALNDFLIMALMGAQQVGWMLEIVQTEREINQSGGYDRVTDPLTGQIVSVKPDSVCRLLLAPSQGIYFSVELDRGTEGPEKIKAKVRAHAAHFTSGAYTKRHQTTSSRILFVVADVRDPLRARPLTEVEWQESIRARCEQLKHWTELAIPGERRDLFWFAPAFALSPQTLYHAAVWQRAGLEGDSALVVSTT
ncbi:MAG: replication-relaxation family protein [Ardenticatenales bacterium]|nr:replication-relaxation family protein [Ardenticatenales bacterium]